MSIYTLSLHDALPIYMFEGFARLRPLLLRHVEFAEFIKWIRGVGFQRCGFFKCSGSLRFTPQSAGQEAKVVLQRVMAGEFAARIFENANRFGVVGFTGVGLRQTYISSIKFRVTCKRRMKCVACGCVV